MPALITLADAKAHSRIDTDDEDAIIQTMVDAAIGYVEHALNNGPLDDTAPAIVKQAGLLVFSDFYSNREAQSDKVLTHTKAIDSLLNMARNYDGFVQ